MKFRSRSFVILRRTVSVLLGSLVGLAIAELAFWLRADGAFPHLNVYRADPVYGARLEPGAVTRVAFGGSSPSDVFIHDGGYRGIALGPEPARAQGEVLFVGDSQTFGLGVEAEQAFPARYAALAGVPSYNAGVPTWGPPEFARALDELGKKRRPHTVVYVVNFANDPFEAERSNVERHAVWDGWAVRRETAPARVVQFPGRDFLFRRSHTVFALRGFLHRAFAVPHASDDRGTPSEGTFRDLVDLGSVLRKEQAQAQRETERKAALYETEATYAEETYRRAESRVRALVWKHLKLGASGVEQPGAPATVYLAADANPGDIVSPGIGEEGRPAYATANYIRQAVELRNQYEAELQRLAKTALESEEAKQIFGALSSRDAERLKMATVRAKALEIVRASSPLTRRVLEAKGQAESLGARFALLVLPLDVMVSASEWPKHGSKRVDLANADVLVQDLVESVQSAGALALDATSSLRAAQPGAFLPGDIHLTQKGHNAVAQALFELLREASPRREARSLPAGRSRVPPPEIWDTIGGEVAVLGSGAAGCPVTKKYREWLYIHCKPSHEKAPKALGLEVVQGGFGQAITAIADGAMTLVAPIPSGASLEALFTWSDGQTRRLVVNWDAQQIAADMRMLPEAVASAKPPDPGIVSKLCGCHKLTRQAQDCTTLIANPHAACLATYASSCAELLACAEGNVLYVPRCSAGTTPENSSFECSEKPRHEADAAARALASRMAESSEATLRALEPLGKAVVRQAQAFVGEGCTLGSDAVELILIIPYDRCPIDLRMVETYRAALSAFETRTRTLELRGEVATFAEKARLFGHWVDVTLQSGDTRGTTAMYQDLALAFNAWQRTARVWVDPPRIVQLYFGTSGVRSIDYFRNLRGDGPKRQATFEASGKHFIWRRGPNGFEGPFLEPTEREVPGY